MFYIRQMQERVVLAPKYLGKKVEEVVQRKLVAEVEGKCTADSGYVLCLLSLDSLTAGVIEDETGSATFLAEYSALTLLPGKGEVVNAVVHEINKMGLFCFVGPFSVFVSMYQIPGQFTEAGDDSSILSNDGGPAIVRGSLVRLRIIGVKVEPSKIFGIGTVNDDYLGCIS
ncbi:DNA-directed RNA polymerase II subunit RPB7 [Nematocida homosporus]|uniref:DNA-directed RNA polymerase II subunit RPB7 n=1 Tax=Nematocida homosporus TaxID=1912981 RepID=UPI002220E6DC|nr:DNA-directed RNA polymerase II subunit RPB7 [Nematocida homosporus]KAI5187316.1 DNA-directed RNA polymerase II subunit RPB7 [Nematocida homosporus]